EPGEPSAPVAARVRAARALAEERGVRCNAELPARRLDEVGPLDDRATSLLLDALRSGRLSARGLHRVRRVARTVADLDGTPHQPGLRRVALAVSLRVDPSASATAQAVAG